MVPPYLEKIDCDWKLKFREIASVVSQKEDLEVSVNCKISDHFERKFLLVSKGLRCDCRLR